VRGRERYPAFSFVASGVVHVRRQFNGFHTCEPPLLINPILLANETATLKKTTAPFADLLIWLISLLQFRER